MVAQHVKENERIVPVLAAYDVIVAGAGMGGVAAALASARHGKKTLLIERMFAVGGLATLGLVTIYLPLCDGMDRQVCFGMNDEFLRLAISHGYEDKYPASWLEGKREHHGQRFEVGFNANVFSILLEQSLSASGCDILYGTNVVGVVREEKSIVALIIENKSGRSVIQTKAVVDATGDADIAALSGTPVACYGKGNALAAWYYETKNGVNTRHMYGAADVLPSDGKDTVPDRLDGGRYSGLDAWENSDKVREAHGAILSKFLADGPVSVSHSLSSIASIPQLRMTRRIVGEYTMDDTEAHRTMGDSVGLVSDWRKRGPVYELPLRCMYSASTVNLLAVGRCISVTDAMWDITRVIPPSVVSGQGAGTAIALSPDVTKLDEALFQDTLRADGVVLHERDL